MKIMNKLRVDMKYYIEELLYSFACAVINFIDAVGFLVTLGFWHPGLLCKFQCWYILR